MKTTTQTRHSNGTVIETARRNFRDALLWGERNMGVREHFAHLLERGDLRRNDDEGRWTLLADKLGEYGKREALGVAAWDQFEHCNALVTHDLASFVCRDVTGLIDKMRIN